MACSIYVRLTEEGVREREQKELKVCMHVLILFAHSLSAIPYEMATQREHTYLSVDVCQFFMVFVMKSFALLHFFQNNRKWAGFVLSLLWTARTAAANIADIGDGADIMRFNCRLSDGFVPLWHGCLWRWHQLLIGHRTNLSFPKCISLWHRLSLCLCLWLCVDAFVFMCLSFVYTHQIFTHQKENDENNTKPNQTKQNNRNKND